jgi:septum formation protein
VFQHDEPRVILASESQARRALLQAAGIRFESRPARIDEDAVKQAAKAEGASPEDTALLLAELKAERIAAREPDAVVIGADQLLECEGSWFDKPASIAAAREQLAALRGRTHTLVTAVLCHRGESRLWHHVASPRLTIRRFSDAFLEEYLAAEGEAITGCVGAYRLEGPGVQLFERIEGDHFSILGLPLLRLLGFLRQHAVLAS